MDRFIRNNIVSTLVITENAHTCSSWYKVCSETKSLVPFKLLPAESKLFPKTEIGF